jgi:hypothetical protein
MLPIFTRGALSRHAMRWARSAGVFIKVQTTGQTAAPVDVLKAAIVDLQGETEALDRGFRDGVAAVRERQMQI